MQCSRSQELGNLRSDGLADYLQGRQLAVEGRYDGVVKRMRSARSDGLPTERLERESSRLLGIGLFATGELQEAKKRWQALRSESGEDLGKHAEAQDWMERIRFEQAEP